MSTKMCRENMAATGLNLRVSLFSTQSFIQDNIFASHNFCWWPCTRELTHIQMIQASRDVCLIIIYKHTDDTCFQSTPTHHSSRHIDIATSPKQILPGWTGR